MDFLMNQLWLDVIFKQKNIAYYDLLQRLNVHHEIESEEDFLQMYVDKVEEAKDSFIFLKISKFGI